MDGAWATLRSAADRGNHGQKIAGPELAAGVVVALRKWVQHSVWGSPARNQQLAHTFVVELGYRLGWFLFSAIGFRHGTDKRVRFHTECCVETRTPPTLAGRSASFGWLRGVEH